MAEKPLTTTDIEELVRRAIQGDQKAWDSAINGSLTQLQNGDPSPWQTLVALTLDEFARGNESMKFKLVNRYVQRPDNGDETTGVETLVNECLSRMGDETKGDGHLRYWALLQELTYHQLIRKCEAMLRQQLSRYNPMISENSLAAEVYLRLHKAIMENQSAAPKTSLEYFGLAARNIRWQMTDMLRKPSADQGGTSVFEGLAAATGFTSQAEDSSRWTEFWEVVNALPENQREVFDLLWIHELTQYEAASLLGFTRDKVKDIWRDVRLHIAKHCNEMAQHFRG